MTGTVGILNVGAGDTKLVFDKNNPQECIRAARIVKDMLRRGYALLVEIEHDGKKGYQRVHEFKEDTCEYIIADFDPVTAEKEDALEAQSNGQSGKKEAGSEAREEQPRKKDRSRFRSVPATGTRAVAVARSAGG